MISPTLSWTEVCAMPWLRDIPAKIETNRLNKIIISPASNWHGNYEWKIGLHLHTHLTGGEIIMECAVDTQDGTRVADVGWIYKDRYRPYRRAASLPVAPDICIEVLSPSNTRAEMLEKMQLYYAAGASEVWLCDDQGKMEFFTKESLASVPHSTLCPDFPLSIEDPES